MDNQETIVMDNQEAIETIKLTLSQIEWEYPMDYAVAFDMAISALEKQIPKKVRITTSTKRCAACGRQLSGIGNIHPKRNYCQGCGQAIDWEDE